jgi:hypothetical protein
MTRAARPIPLASVGILAIRAEFAPVFVDVDVLVDEMMDAYEAGRAARLANFARDDYPIVDDPELTRNWQRGWDVVDYALNHPEEDSR